MVEVENNIKRLNDELKELGIKDVDKAQNEIDKLEEKAEATPAIKKGALVSIKNGATYYNGQTIPAWVMGMKWYVASVSGDRAVIDKDEDGKYHINSPVNVANLKAVKTAKIGVGSTVKVKKGAKRAFHGRKHLTVQLLQRTAQIGHGFRQMPVQLRDLMQRPAIINDLHNFASVILVFRQSG